jgi:hypothetical protein
MAQHSRIKLLDTPTTFQSNANASTYSFSYSLPAGTNNRCVVLYFSERDNTISATRAPAVKFDGTDIVLSHASLNAENNDAADDPGCTVQYLYVGNKAAGSYTVEIDYAAALIAVTAVVFTLDNVDTTFNPTLGSGYVSNNNGAVTSVNNSITTATDRCIAIQCLTVQLADGTLTPTGSQTTLYLDGGNNGAGPSTFCGYIAPEAATSQAFPASFASDDYAEIIVFFKPYRRRNHTT